MNLTKANISDLRKVTVKIECSNGSQGSGTIVKIGEIIYVLTAAHVIENNSTGGHLPYDQIVFSITRNSQKYSFSVSDIVYYNRSEDTCVIVVANTGDMPLGGLDKVRLLTTSVSGPAELCAFHRGEYTPKHYSFVNRGEKTWAIEGIQTTVQSLEPVNNFEGTSGGGLFYQDTAKNLYMVAYMSEVGRLDGNNNEFICMPSTNFISSGVVNSIVDYRDYDYIADSGVASSTDRRQLLKPLDNSGYDLNQTGPFIENIRTSEIISQLRNDDTPTILMTALSGMGKSKLIYEAFKDTAREPRRYYAKYNHNREQLTGELKQILGQNYGNDGIIIIDDCPMELVSEVISIRNQYNEQFRLIMAHHDYFNSELEQIKSFPVIKLKPQEMEERIGIYISEELLENEHNKNDISEIKRLASGYPQMAIELVKAYKENATAGPEAVAHLMPRLLNLTEGIEKEERYIWQTLSLCMPFPYMEASHEGFRFLLEDNLVTPLNGMQYEERRSIAGRLIETYYPTLIDVQGMWLYIRPFPLAVWLTSEWFRTVCNTSVHFRELIVHIRQQPEWLQNAISEGFCKHIQQMSGNKEAFRMVDHLVNADINHPFFNEENLCSGLGSKLFLAMSTVNPAAIAVCLRRILGSKNTSWLRDHFDGDGRRNVVWALERLSFARESYNDAVYMMAKLAIAENECIGNNATGQLIQLFHIVLAGTEVDLNARLKTLKLLVDEGDEYDTILINCFDAALRNSGFTKMYGAEKFGFENKKDYTPQNWQEIYNYWYGCRDLLMNWMNKKPEVASMIASMVEKNVYNWARGGQKDILVPLMNKIAIIKNYQWDKGYEALAKTLYTFGINIDEIGLADLMEKLRNGLFMTKLKDARNKLHGKYRLKDKDKLTVTQELFFPLSDEFLQMKIYLNSNDIKAMLEEKEYIPIAFTKRIVMNSDDEQLACFFNTTLDVVSNEPDDFISPFLSAFSYEARERKPFIAFLEKLRNNGHELLYVNLMSGTEDDSLSHFNRLIIEQANGMVKTDFLKDYLRFFTSYTNQRFLLLLKNLREKYHNRPNDLISYVISERYSLQLDEQIEVVEIVKEALLNFQIGGDNCHQLNDYSRILVDVLKQWPDNDFANKINHKMIDVYRTQMVHLSTEGIFTELLRDYFGVVWHDFINAFLDDKSFLFYFQVKDELGSGFGFGKGPLFDLDESLIKQICLENPVTAPVRIASMVPCYEVDENGNNTNMFNKWILWLLDNFGEQKDVRDSISSNLGSFSWVGPISSYYERNIKCFEMLLNHPKREVQEWAQKCISDEKKMLEMEKNNEDFMKLRYNM